MSADDWPTLAFIEREHILARLAHFDGNKTWTAKSLGIAMKTLYNRLAKYGKVVPSGKTADAASVQELRERRAAANARRPRDRGGRFAPTEARIPTSGPRSVSRTHGSGATSAARRAEPESRSHLRQPAKC